MQPDPISNEPVQRKPAQDKRPRRAALGTQPPSRRFPLNAVFLPLAFVLGLGLGYILWGENPAPSAAQTADNAAISTPQEVRRYDISSDDDPSLGNASAKITIVEFSDFECPFCTKWHNEVWPKIQAAYPDDVRLVYRDFPLTSIHGNAAPAAEAANCAGEQNAYWQYHGLLFASQYGLGQSAYEKYASDLGLDAAAFAQCLESRRYKDEVQADFEYASNLGISSTPTFFINGIAVVGAQGFDVFKQIIDMELAGELPE